MRPSHKQHVGLLPDDVSQGPKLSKPLSCVASLDSDQPLSSYHIDVLASRLSPHTRTSAMTNPRQTESKCNETSQRFFLDQKTHNGPWLRLGGASRRAQPTWTLRRLDQYFIDSLGFWEYWGIYSAKRRSGGAPEVGTTHQGAPGPPGAPWWVVLSSEHPRRSQGPLCVFCSIKNLCEVLLHLDSV